MNKLFRKRRKAVKRIVCASVILAMVVTVPTYDGTEHKSVFRQKTNVFATSAKEKKKKAEALNVKIINEDEFLKMIEEPREKKATPVQGRLF